MSRRAKSPVEERRRKAIIALRRLNQREELKREALDLGASDLACAVADSWAAVQRYNSPAKTALLQYNPTLCGNLNRLEEITRPSAMRKVRP